MEIKGKHIVFIILIILDIMGIYWIEENPTFLGILSSFSILITVMSLVWWLIVNYNETIFKI